MEGNETTLLLVVRLWEISLEEISLLFGVPTFLYLSVPVLFGDQEHNCLKSIQNKLLTKFSVDYLLKCPA